MRLISILFKLGALALAIATIGEMVGAWRDLPAPGSPAARDHIIRVIALAIGAAAAFAIGSACKPRPPRWY